MARFALGCTCGFTSRVIFDAAAPEDVMVRKSQLDEFWRQHATQASNCQAVVPILVEIKSEISRTGGRFPTRLEPRPAVAKMETKEPWPGI